MDNPDAETMELDHNPVMLKGTQKTIKQKLKPTCLKL